MNRKIVYPCSHLVINTVSSRSGPLFQLVLMAWTGCPNVTFLDLTDVTINAITTYLSVNLLRVCKIYYEMNIN